ncbi:MAG: MBL fold metallo-hydrolase [Chloroflexi bacterium]|nr:MAG: MBL fold metallo-hydrolase [Chloroflexota bacterium]
MLRITFVGHATMLIEMDGVRLLTDPVLRRKVMHLRRRPPGVSPDSTQNIDAVLLSHMHFDHLDLPSLEMLGPDTRLIVPPGMGPMLARRGYRQIEELESGSETGAGPLRIQATPALHDRARFRYGPTADTLGFVIHGAHSIYFPGDTDLFPEMSDLAKQLDVALLPVWGWGPTLGKGHMDPYRAALALQMLKPAWAVPIHWGTLHPWGMQWLNPQFLFDPPRAFARFAADLAPDVAVHILEPGQSLAYPAGAE